MVDKYQIVCIAFLPSFYSSQINIISHKKQRSGSLKVCFFLQGDYAIGKWYFSIVLLSWLLTL